MKKILTIGIMLLFIGMTITSSTGFNVEKQLFVATLDGKTLYVGGSGPGNYTKIQDAINDASEGDTVFVYDDSSPYVENLIVDKSISLIGEDKHTTVIDGNEKKDAHVTQIKADGITLQGFTIQNGSIVGDSDWGHAIEVLSHNNTIKDNIITDNMCGIVIGERLDNSSNNNVIEGNVVSKNDFGGVCLEFAFDNTISRNIISSNKHYGVSSSYDSSRNCISQNNITNNNGTGVSIHGGTNNSILQNHIVGNGRFGVSIGYSSWNYVNYNNIYDNNINAIVEADTWNAFISILKYREPLFDHSWGENYWGRPLSLPKLIIGKCYFVLPFLLFQEILFDLNLILYIPVINFDWHPAQEPYDMEV